MNPACRVKNRPVMPRSARNRPGLPCPLRSRAGAKVLALGLSMAETVWNRACHVERVGLGVGDRHLWALLRAMDAS